MVVTISGTTIQIIGEPEIIFEGNNLVDTFAATTDKDETWQYNLDIYMPLTKQYNSIIMTRNSNMLSVLLTKQMLPTEGKYVCQFRGQSGDAVYHTDKFCIWVKSSIDLNDAYDPMPAEFYQMESQMKDILKQVQETAAETLPEINESTNGQFLTNNGVDASWSPVEAGLTQDIADQRYLQLSGGTMAGDIDMGDHNLNNVSFVKAAGTYKNAGIHFNSDGTIINFVTGNSTALELSANNINVVNHGIDNVDELNMRTNGNITRAGLVGGNVEQNNKTCVDFTTENQVGIWAQGNQKVIVSDDGVNVNNNEITGVKAIVANGSNIDGLRFESDGYIASIICDGNRAISFTSNSIDAYEHPITRVSNPTNDTDAANKQYVDTSVSGVQTNIDTVSATVDDILDGTEALPYLDEASGDGRYLKLTGGTLTGALNMGNNKIAMGATPTGITDVTNKGYVDGVVKVVSDEVDGILAGTTPVAIPAATETHIGGIKPGAGTAVSGDGTLTIIVPVPTAEDDGKLLVVEGGAYVLKTLAEIQGGT